MKIIPLKREQKLRAIDMDPFCMLSYMDFSKGNAMVAVEENETGENWIGLMVYVRREESLEIKWIYVKQEFRFSGIGEKLLAIAFELSIQEQLKTVNAYFNRDEQREELFSGSEQYFRERLFLTKKELSGEWNTDVQTIVAHPFFAGKNEHSYQVYPLRYLGHSERKEKLSKLFGKKLKQTSYLLEDNDALLFDPDLSLLILKGEKVCGGFLAQCVVTPHAEAGEDKTLQLGTHNTLYPVLFHAESTREAMTILKELVGKLKEKYSPDTAIRIVLKDNKHEALMKSIAPDACIENWVLTANVSDYVRWKKLVTEYNQNNRNTFEQEI